MYNKKTIRKMQPQTKKIALIINEAEGAIRKLKRLMPVIERMEGKSQITSRLMHPADLERPVDEIEEMNIKPTKQPKRQEDRNTIAPINWDNAEEANNGS